MNAISAGTFISSAQADSGTTIAQGPVAKRTVAKSSLDDMSSVETSRLRKIGKGASTIFFANLLYAGCQWLILILLAKFKDPTAVGEFSYVFAVTSPLVLLSGLQLKTVLVTDSAQRFAFADYVIVRIATGALLILGIAGYGWMYPNEDINQTALWLMTGAKIIESISDLLQGVFLRHQRTSLICWSMLIRGTASTIMFVVGLLLLDSVAGSIAGLACGYLATLLLFDLPQCLRVFRGQTRDQAFEQQHLSDESGKSVFSRRLLQLLTLGLPLGLTVALNSATSNMPRYFLEAQIGMYEVGVFSAIAMVLRLGFYVENALNQAALPSLSHAFSTQDRNGFIKTTQWLLACCSLLLVVGSLLSFEFGELLLTIAYSQEYAGYSMSLVVLMVGQGIGYHAGVLKTAIDASGSFRIQVPLFVTSLLSALATAWWLVPKFGIMGAALSMLSPKIVLVVGYALLFFHVIKRKFMEKVV